jgi:hypothetical protein
MAIPTDFKGFTPAANTSKSFKLLGSATTGVWCIDVDGTLSATCVRVDLGDNLVLFMDQAYTDAALVAKLQDFLKRMGGLHEGAGGQIPDATKQVAVTATTCT